MRIILAILFGLLVGGILGTIGGALIGLFVLILIRYNGDLTEIERVALSFQWLGLGLAGLPIGAVMGVIVGAARARPWLERLLLGSLLGALIGAGGYMLMGLTIWLESGITFAIVGGILGLIQSGATALVERFARPGHL